MCTAGSRAAGARWSTANSTTSSPTPTAARPASTNLAGFCVRHHHLKHAGGGWQVRALPDGGLEWITPTGHRHVTRPYDYRGDPDPP